MSDAITVLDFPEVTSSQEEDIIYAIRGGSADRDKKIALKNINGSFFVKKLTANTTQGINLSTYFQDIIIFSTPAADITLTFSGNLPDRGKFIVVNLSATYKITVAGTAVSNIIIPPNGTDYWICSGATLLWGREKITVRSAGFNSVPSNSSAASITIDWSIGNIQSFTVDQNTTLVFTNPIIGSMLLNVTHHSGQVTLTMPSCYYAGITGLSAAVLTLPSGNTKKTQLSIFYDGTSYWINDTPFYALV